MTSLALILTLFAERFSLAEGPWRQTHWFLNKWRNSQLLSWLASHRSGQMLFIAPPLLLISLINWLLAGWFWGLPSLIFAAAVLLWCLGPEGLEPQLMAWQEALELGETEKEAALANQLCNQDLPHPEDAPGLDVIADCLWLAALRRLFGPIFWFLLFGLLGAAPVGAALYWLVREQRHLLGQDQASGKADTEDCRWLAWLDWLPTRLLVYSLALVGDYSGTLARSGAFRLEQTPDCTSTRVLLSLAGRGALGCQETPDMAAAAMAIIWRALALWVLIACLIWLLQ